MSTTAARKTASRKSAAKSIPTTAPMEQMPAAHATAKHESKTEPKSLVEALTTGQARLLAVRANGTRRSLPYLAVGTEQRKQAEAVAKMREKGQAVEAIAEALNVSTATARRFITNLDLARAVEAGQRDKGWKLGTREVIVHIVTAKPTTA